MREYYSEGQKYFLSNGYKSTGDRREVKKVTQKVSIRINRSKKMKKSFHDNSLYWINFTLIWIIYSPSLFDPHLTPFVVVFHRFFLLVIIILIIYLFINVFIEIFVSSDAYTPLPVANSHFPMSFQLLALQHEFWIQLLLPLLTLILTHPQWLLHSECCSNL